MAETEVLLNLWYVFDEMGVIYSLRGRCYVASGSDQEKLAFLCEFAATDYLIARSFPVPERLQTTLSTEQNRRVPIALAEVIDQMGGPQVLFEEVFVEVEKELPAQTRLSISDCPLVCITPLLANDDGDLTPITSPSGRLRVHRTSLSVESQLEETLAQPENKPVFLGMSMHR